MFETPMHDLLGRARAACLRLRDEAWRLEGLLRLAGLRRPGGRAAAEAPAPGNRSARHREAAGRLRAARRHFEQSMIAVRTAALDHVDGQHRLGVVLDATLDRLAADPRP